MPVVLSIKRDFKDVDRALKKLSIKVQKKVVPAAINKTAKKAKTEMTRAITSEFNIKAADVRSRLRILKARKNLDQWGASLDPFAKNRRGRSLNLIRFLEKKVSLAEGRRRGKAGNKSALRFQIKKSGGKKTITGAFIGNRGRTFFRRTGDGRTPIEAVSTIDVPQMFNTRKINRRVLARIRKELPIEVNRAINAAIKGYF